VVALDGERVDDGNEHAVEDDRRYYARRDNLGCVLVSLAGDAGGDADRREADQEEEHNAQPDGDERLAQAPWLRADSIFRRRGGWGGRVHATLRAGTP